MGVLVDGQRLTDLRPGESGVITTLELGKSELARFTTLKLTAGTEVCVRKYVAGSGPLFVQVQGSHVVIVNVEGFLIIGDELYDYKLPGDFVFVEVNGQEKQLSSMETGENGVITQIAGGGNLNTELDKHWIKERNEIRVFHKKEPDAHPLMVSVNGVCHHIPTGLTEKIYVEVIN
jgi:Fe2+ transport system protein FeoA